VAAQAFHDLDALADRGSEVTCTFDQVTLVEIIGPDADPHQVLHELALDVDVIVDTGQQHRLVPERNPCSGKTVAGLFEFQRDFAGVVDVDVQPERVVFCQHVTQFLGDAHRHENGDT
jgi:hypothetical protein